MIPPFPLQWPEGLARTKNKADSRFKATLPQALKSVEDSLRRFAADSGQRVQNVVITSNVTLGVNTPVDTGVAVWFTWDDEQRVIAVDRYPAVAHNVQAIHHIIEARRTELRHGGLNVVRQTFKGFTALPAPANKRNWWEVLGLPGQTCDGHPWAKRDIDGHYRAAAGRVHPDKPGGSHDKMAELNKARDEALAEIG